jgi:hypothetical protein
MTRYDDTDSLIELTYAHLVVLTFGSGEGWKYLSVVVPMVLVNVMSTLANLETAAAVGDHYDPTTSILTGESAL